MLPYYVAAPTRPGQSSGWYWTPRGAKLPEMIGADVYMAEAFLLRALEQPPA